MAPLFAHGEGRGVTVCVVISPPVFLSEEEGMQIIREALTRQGIDLKPGGILAGVRVPARPTPLKLDGVDAAKKIGVEFVCLEDYFELGGSRSGSTVHRFDFKEVAQYLGTLARKQGRDPSSSGSSTIRRPELTLAM